MAAPTKERLARSDADLQELIALIGGADSVELKLTLPDSDQRSTITALALDPRSSSCARSFPATCRMTYAAPPPLASR